MNTHLKVFFWHQTDFASSFWSANLLWSPSLLLWSPTGGSPVTKCWWNIWQILLLNNLWRRPLIESSLIHQQICWFHLQMWIANKWYTDLHKTKQYAIYSDMGEGGWGVGVFYIICDQRTFVSTLFDIKSIWTSKCLNTSLFWKVRQVYHYYSQQLEFIYELVHQNQAWVGVRHGKLFIFCDMEVWLEPFHDSNCLK